MEEKTQDFYEYLLEIKENDLKLSDEARYNLKYIKKEIDKLLEVIYKKEIDKSLCSKIPVLLLNGIPMEDQKINNSQNSNST